MIDKEFVYNKVEHMLKLLEKLYYVDKNFFKNVLDDFYDDIEGEIEFLKDCVSYIENKGVK